MKTRYLPLVLFGLLVVVFVIALTRTNSLHQNLSPLIGKSAPVFTVEGLSSKDMVGTVVVINFFASWCLTCTGEVDELEQIKSLSGVTLYGIAYKDKKENMKNWLKKFGNPYRKIGMDNDGGLAIDFGVYGVPETYVLDKKGVILTRYVGPLTEDNVEDIKKMAAAP